MPRDDVARDADPIIHMERVSKDMRFEDVRIGMKEDELRATLGAPYRVQLAGASMVYRWQDAHADEEASEWLRVRLRRIGGHSLAHAVVDRVEGRSGGKTIAMP